MVIGGNGGNSMDTPERIHRLHLEAKLALEQRRNHEAFVLLLERTKWIEQWIAEGVDVNSSDFRQALNDTTTTSQLIQQNIEMWEEAVQTTVFTAVARRSYARSMAVSAGGGTRQEV